MSRPSLALCLFLTLLATGAGAEEGHRELRGFMLDRVELAELEAPSQNVYRRLSRAMAQVGVFAVGLPETSGEAVQAGLRSFAGCAGNSAASAAELPVSQLGDGSERTSLALGVNASVPQPLPEAVAASCPGFSATSGALRGVVERTGAAAARLVDGLVLGGEGEFDSFADAVASAESLEHFHYYKPQQQPNQASGDGAVGGAGAAAAEEGQGEGDDAQAALEMHSDVGLFLVMAPAALLQADTLLPVAGSPPGAGLRLRLPSGEIVAPEVPQGSLLVMMGEAAERWMRLPPSLALHAPAHEVFVPQRPGVVRAWYGRMFFPPKEAQLAASLTTGSDIGSRDGSNSLTWGEYRAQTMDAFVRGDPEEASTAGCSPATSKLGDEKTCAHGYVYCWMTCMSVAPTEGRCEPEEAVCVDNVGKLWPDDYSTPSGKPQHCYDCKVLCPDDAPKPSGGDEAMCIRNLTATVMWMTGFQSLSDIRDQPCLAFLFDWFPIHSATSFAAAVLLTVLGGVSVEGIVYGRRQILAHPFKIRTRAARAAFSLLMVIIYAVQVTMGYLLMLVAMTYQLELFAAVVAGLCLGHAVFNAKAPVLDSAEACCMSLDAWTPYPTDPPDALQRQLSDPTDPLHTEPPSCCAPVAMPGNNRQHQQQLQQPLL